MSLQLQSPTKLKYHYKTPPFAHQKKALNKILKLGGKAALFMEMGTGKTKVAIDWAGIAYNNWGARRVLVVAPLSVLGVWPREIRKHSSVPSRVFRLEGSSHRRATTIKQLIRARKHLANDLSFVIINYEGIWREPDRGTSIESLLIQWEPDIIIFDESHRLKSPSSKQSKAAHRIARTVPQRLLLSGTPITKAPLDAFGQFRALDDRIFGTKWNEFRFKYGVWGGFGKYQLRGYKSLPELIEKVRNSSYRVRKDQCLDLPEKVYLEVPVTLSVKAQKIYRDMAKQMIAELEEDQLAIARIVLTKLLRLSQITGGFVKDIDNNIQIFDDSKLKVCMDLIDDLVAGDEKVVIFTRFIPDIERIVEQLTNRGIQYRILSGSVPPLQRDSFVQEFHTKPHIKVFVAQIQAGSLGIDLTCASHAIFYSLTYNAADYWQAQDRLHRHGQTKKVTYYHLIAPHTIDQVVLRVLKEKGKIADTVLHDPKILLP